MDDETPLLLRAGTASASIHPAAGGRLGQLTVDAWTYLRGPEHAHLGWSQWGAFPLLPWSNRIPDGRIRFEGRDLEVPPSWEDGSAIHGLAAAQRWEVVGSTIDTTELAIEVTAGSYRVGGRQRWSLSPTALDLELEVVNLGDDRVPAGLGIHPWFRATTIAVPADRFWPGEPLPIGLPQPVTDHEDLRVLRAAPPMDRTYTGLTANEVHAGGLRLSWTGPITHVVVFSGVPGWVCVEPVTMVNDGFRLADEGVEGTGVIALDPGTSMRVTFRFAW